MERAKTLQRMTCVVLVCAATASQAQETLERSGDPEEWAPSTVALVGGQYLPTGAATLALEHRLGKQTSLYAAAAASFSSQRLASVAGEQDFRTVNVGLVPGLRWYLSERSLSGPFLGALVPLSLAWTDDVTWRTTSLTVAVQPHAGVALRFERLVVQLTFGLSAALRIPLSESLPPGSAPIWGTGSGTSIGLASSVAFGYAF